MAKYTSHNQIVRIDGIDVSPFVKRVEDLVEGQDAYSDAYLAGLKAAGVTEIVVRAEGPKLVLDPDLRAALAGTLPIEGLASRTAAAWMVRQLVEEVRGEIALSPPGEPVLLFGASIPDRG